MSTTDLAVIGAGAAGTWLAHAVQRARPEWSITLFERSQRIGGRLWSVAVPAIDHPIDLGGMRYLTSQRRVASVVSDLGIPTRPFDLRGGPERSFLRGHLGSGPADPDAGAGYDLADEERGRSAVDLLREALLRIVPDAERLDASGWAQVRAAPSYGGRALTDWSIGEVLASIRSPAGHRFTTDAFGYDSGIRAFNAPDAVQFLLGGGDPSAAARVPEEGMDRIPRALAAAFEARGGRVALSHELLSVTLEGWLTGLRFSTGTSVVARRLVLALPVSALRLLAEASPLLQTPSHRGIFDAVEGFPATKLYLWYERPWWRDDGTTGIRATTDLPNRKVFYFDIRPDAPAAILGAYADGRHAAEWIALADGASDGAPAPAAMLASIGGHLAQIHPAVADVPEPIGSAFMHWGAAPREIAWTFWRPGFVSDEIMAAAIQPDPSTPLYICGESFSRAQSWAEGALETAEVVASRLLEGPA